MKRLSSTATVVLVQVLTWTIQSGITASLALGGLGGALSADVTDQVRLVWTIVRALPIALVILLWLFGRKQTLFRAMILANIFLTVGLLANAVALIDLLVGNPSARAGLVFSDVLLMALSNILIFSIWYWLIDPPGIDESLPSTAPWDFLFPQRAQAIPQYETWTPRYTDYLHLAFTTSVAFSPTDTLPLTARAKMLMNLQAGISLVTLVFIAGAAINLLA